MVDQGRWAGLLAEAAAERDAQPRRISELCVEMLGVTGAGISMVTTSGNHGVVCATDEVSAKIEDLQLTLGEGPCIDSVRGGSPVLISDLGALGDFSGERWPAFLEGAGAAGVRAVFAFPLRIGAISVGAMDLYRDVPGDLAVDELPAALMAADAAAHALLHLDDPPDATASRGLRTSAPSTTRRCTRRPAWSRSSSVSRRTRRSCGCVPAPLPPTAAWSTSPETWWPGGSASRRRMSDE